MTPSRTQSRVGRADSLAISRAGCCAAVPPNDEAMRAITNNAQQTRRKHILSLNTKVIMPRPPILSFASFAPLRDKPSPPQRRKDVKENLNADQSRPVLG